MILDRKSDPRGWLVEIFRDELVNGQVYVFTINPGMKRGGHFHKRKVETFCILQGKVKLTLLHLDNGNSTELVLASNIAVEKVPVANNIVHTFENVGEIEAIVLAFISEKFNAEDPDTFFP